MSHDSNNITVDLRSRFGDKIILNQQQTIDGTPTLWVDRNGIVEVIKVSEKRYQSAL